MSDQHPSSFDFQILSHFSLAGFGFAGALVFWQMSVPGFELFLFFAGLFALGGMIRLSKGLIGIFRYILARRKWARYAAQGNAPKTDRMARTDDLKRKGLTR